MTYLKVFDSRFWKKTFRSVICTCASFHYQKSTFTKWNELCFRKFFAYGELWFACHKYLTLLTGVSWALYCAW